MYTLKLSEPFINDVDSSVNYIKHTLQAPVAAKRLSDEVKKAYKKIKETPFIYPAVPDKYLASLGYRFTMVNNYMMFYIVENKTINISRFLYGHRDWINILGETETQ
jgi:plasmid stabilization system protein ParE